MLSYGPHTIIHFSIINMFFHAFHSTNMYFYEFNIRTISMTHLTKRNFSFCFFWFDLNFPNALQLLDLLIIFAFCVCNSQSSLTQQHLLSLVPVPTFYPAPV